MNLSTLQACCWAGSTTAGTPDNLSLPWHAQEMTEGPGGSAWGLIMASALCMNWTVCS